MLLHVLADVKEYWGGSWAEPGPTTMDLLSLPIMFLHRNSSRGLKAVHEDACG